MIYYDESLKIVIFATWEILTFKLLKPIMKDLFARIIENKGPLGKWASHAEGYFVFPKLEGPISNRMRFNGKEVITWSINDYLGLANHPEVRKIDAEAASEHGCAYPMGARMMSGHTDIHEQLQDELAAFVGKEAAYLLNFGYQGIMSAIDALVTKDDIIVYDVDCHACIIDGVRLHMGKRFTFKYKFRFLVDDAHGFGTLGETGAGAGEEQGIMHGIDVYFATFAKSMASIGAFLAGDKEVMDYLKYNLRSQMFAKSLPMVFVKGALKRLDMLRTMPELKNKLWENVNELQNGLKKRGFNIGTTTSCVTPVYLNGSIPEAMALVKDLRENYGIFCSIVVYPVIPKGLILLRMIPTATHTIDDINETLEAFSAIRERLENGTYKRMAAAVAAAMGE